MQHEVNEPQSVAIIRNLMRVTAVAFSAPTCTLHDRGIIDPSQFKPMWVLYESAVDECGGRGGPTPGGRAGNTVVLV